MAKAKKLDYKAQRAIWYAKLKKSGFTDIETDTGQLRRTGAQLTYYGNEITWQAKQQYYYMANQFLHNYKFNSNLERIIWEYHSNGISNRDIVNLLNKTKITNTNRETIRLMIKRLSKIMRKAYLVQDE